MNKKTSILVAAVAFLLFAAGCGKISPVKISELYENTHKYENETVLVRGTVNKSISMFGLTGFILTDGTKELMVVGHDSTPSPGEKITVRGELSVPLRWQDDALLVLNASPKEKKD
ncbi:MAG: hypothetical protein GXY75_07835 [Bacteroidales bacterium]|jgi:hypothetical protein|nr:hypothetical protein [Bacteroidales bacterium]